MSENDLVSTVQLFRHLPFQEAPSFPGLESLDAVRRGQPLLERDRKLVRKSLPSLVADLKAASENF
jgi:hypothetical protein